jgi:hypothetical protein
MHLISYPSHLYAGSEPRYLAHTGVVLKPEEYTTGRAAIERAVRLSFGPSGRGAAQIPVPRPSIMLRSIYLAFGFLALRSILRRQGQTDLLLRLRNAGF